MVTVLTHLLVLYTVLAVAEVTAQEETGQSNDNFEQCNCGDYRGPYLNVTTRVANTAAQAVFIDFTTKLGEGRLVTFFLVADVIPDDVDVRPVRLQIWDADIDNPFHFRATLILEKSVNFTKGLSKVYKVCLKQRERIWLRPSYRLGLLNEGHYSVISVDHTDRQQRTFVRLLHDKTAYPVVGSQYSFGRRTRHTKFKMGIQSDNGTSCPDECCSSGGNMYRYKVAVLAEIILFTLFSWN